MKKAIFTVLLSMIALRALQAQQTMVIKATADYLVYDDNNIHLYTKQSNGSLVGKIGEIDFSTKPHTVSFREFETVATLGALKAKLQSYQKLIKVTDLDQYTRDQLAAIIKDKTWYYKAGEDIYRINNFHAGLLATDGIDHREKELRIYSTGVFNTAVLQFESGHAMFLVAGNNMRNSYFNSYIMPINDSFRYGNNMLHDGAYYGYSKEQIKAQDNASMASFAAYSNYDVTGKYIKDLAFDRPLIETAFDSIQLAGNVIFAREKEMIRVFNKQLKDITPLGLRAFVLFDYDKLEVLVGNEKLFLNDDGSLTATAQKNPVGVCGTVNSWTSAIIKKDGFYQMEYVFDGSMTGSGITKNTYTLFKEGDYDSVTFFNGEIYLYEDENSGYTNTAQLPVLIAYNKKGHHFFNYKWIQSWVDYKPVSLLKVDKASTAVFDTVYFKEQSTFLRVGKKGLLGYFPVHKQPKFTSLEPMKSNFARFELPNGKQGRIQNNATEYLDL